MDNKENILLRIWRKIKIPLFVIAVVYVLLVLSRLPVLFERKKTEEVVSFVNSQKLTIEDVMGDNLPPEPDPTVVDLTVEGIDANNNWIRDDVELEIFKRYPNDPKIRAAMLQYAMALQLELTQVFNEGSWRELAKNTGNAIGCIVDVSFEEFDDIGDQINYSEKWRVYIDELVINNEKRKKRESDVNSYTTSYSDGTDESCHLDITSI